MPLPKAIRLPTDDRDSTRRRRSSGAAGAACISARPPGGDGSSGVNHWTSSAFGREKRAQPAVNDPASARAKTGGRGKESLIATPLGGAGGRAPSTASPAAARARRRAP